MVGCRDGCREGWPDGVGTPTAATKVDAVKAPLTVATRRKTSSSPWAQALVLTVSSRGAAEDDEEE